ncbi:MAG: pitrilysin family protein [Candidatus Eisenbacteria bacterium]
MIVYLLEDPEFPVVDAQALIRVGSIYEPAEKVGLAEITGTVMRTEEPPRSTETPSTSSSSRWARASSELRSTSRRASLSALAEDFETGLQVLADVLRRPAFPQEKIDLAKKQERTAISSRNDDPFGVMMREVPKLIYGPDSPYARHTEYATIDAIERDDLVDFHQRFVHPDRIILTVSGDFQSAQAKEWIRQVFGDWPPATSPMPADPPAEMADLEGNFLIQKGDMTNSFVVVAEDGLRMDDPDYPAMQLYHEVMGGGFASRLFNEIRTKRGLAYASGSNSGAQMHHAGGQIFFAATQADSTVRTLGYVEAEIEKSLREPFTAEELDKARDGILNSLVFDFSSKFAILNRLANYEFYGYPADFLQAYQKRIAELTPQEVFATAQRHVVPPDQAATFIMGNEERFSGDLAKVGPVTEIDISIPEAAGSQIPVATAADLERGQGLLAQAAEAHGASAIGKIHDLTVSESGNFSVQGMQLQVGISTKRLLPDCELAEQKLPMGTMTQSVCGDVAWVNRMRGPEAMPDDMRADVRSAQVRDYLSLLGRYQGLEAQALPEPATVDDHVCDVVYVRNDLVQGWKIYLDRTSHRLVRMEYRDKGLVSGQPVTAWEDFGDYREVEGLLWPYERKIWQDEEPLATLTTTSVAVNTGLDPSTFAMPGQ